MTRQRDNRRANATIGAGVTAAAAGGVAREVGIRRALEAHDIKGKRPKWVSRKLVDMPKERNGLRFSPGRARTLYVGGTALGLTGATSMAHGVRSRKVKKRSVVTEGVLGTKDALTDKKKQLSDGKTSRKQHVAQISAAVGGAITGSEASNNLFDRKFPRAAQTMKKPIAGAIAGAGTSAAGLLTVQGHYKRKKRKLQPPSSAARIVDGRNGASRSRFRSEVVPSDVRKREKLKPLPKARNTLYNRGRWAMDYDDTEQIRQLLPQIKARNTRTSRRLVKEMQGYLDVSKLDTNYSGYGMDHKKKRAIVAGSGSIPGVGGFTSAAAAARMAPPEQRRRAAAQQFVSDTGGGITGAAAGAYAGGKLAQGRMQKPIERGAARITGIKNAGRKRLGLPAKAGGKGKIAGQIVGGVIGGSVGSQSASAVSYDNILRRERKRNAKIHKKAVPAPDMTLAEQKRQIKRKKRNAAVNVLSATGGLASAAMFGASVKAKNPQVKEKLARRSLGIGVTTAVPSGLNQIYGARITHKDIKAQEKALVGKNYKHNVAKAMWVEKALGGVTIPRPRVGVPQRPPMWGTRRPTGVGRAKRMRSAGNVMRRNSSGIMRVSTRRAGLG